MESDTIYDTIIAERANAALNERERIIALLGQDIHEQDDWFEMRYDHMVALIRGEN